MSPGRFLLPAAALFLTSCAVVVNPVGVANQWLPDDVHISDEGTLSVYTEGVRISVLAPEGMTGFPLSPGVYGPGDFDEIEARVHALEQHVELEFDEHGTGGDGFELSVRGERVRVEGGVLRIGSRVLGAVRAGDDVVIAADYVTVNGYLRETQATAG